MTTTRTFSIFVRFRKGKLALRRGLLSLRDALQNADQLAAQRFHERDDVFVVCDATGEEFRLDPRSASVARALDEERADTMRAHYAHLEEVLARARRARDGAVVAAERVLALAERVDDPTAAEQRAASRRLATLTRAAAEEVAASARLL
ncbi:MAG TPA: hypothetical protein VHB21_23810, partial [Minicystis sp.]|nr:hypothetical protein [Minicystis sp.]